MLDVLRHAERAGRVDLDGIDFDAFVERPLDPDTLRCLRYVHDVEHHTVCYLRDLLMTPAHRDPEMTTFLTMWVFEEHWHGDAIAKVLAAHGEPAGAARVAEVRRRTRGRARLTPYLHALAAVVASADHPAVLMTWGAVNEWTTQAGYARIAARAGHPELTELTRRIMRQEGTHIAFYAGQARARLADRPRAQQLTRLALRHFWNPVGADVMPEAEVAFLVQHLFGDEEGRQVAARVDTRIQSLPGLERLTLLEGARQHYLQLEQSGGATGRPARRL